MDVFQRYKRITGGSGNAPMEKDLSRNIENGPGVSAPAPQQQTAPARSSAPAPGRYRYDPASGEMRPY